MTSEIKRLTYSTFGSYDHVGADAGEISFAKAVASHCCPCCQTAFRLFIHSASSARSLHLLLCPACGWWHLHREERFRKRGSGETYTARWWELHHAIHSEISLDSPSLPIEQLRQHLGRFWEQRKHISAQQAEDLVAAILRDYHGGDVFRITANANAPDGGVDLFVASQDGLVRRAVQVRRRVSHDVEAVQDVRNFIGAMLLRGIDNGVSSQQRPDFPRMHLTSRRMPTSQDTSLISNSLTANACLSCLSLRTVRGRFSCRRWSISVRPGATRRASWSALATSCLAN